MSNTEKWIDEYERRLNDEKTIQDAEIELNSIFENILMNERVILTSRIKSVNSLKEKIKRNRLDNEQNKNSSVFDILEDCIGIRIICKKNCDESKINNILIKNTENLRNVNHIIFKEDLSLQPGYQKNGHEIYRVKCTYKDSIQFELQIKSLSNLFWGEMEHPLIYKNNKYIIKQNYYKKEMDSIFKELHGIDYKLEYMENSMMNEDLSTLLDEKKDITRRLLYLNIKDSLYNIQGEYLNNNHIYEAVTNMIFKPYKEKRSSTIDSNTYYNNIMLDSLNFILNTKKMNIDFNRFSTNILTEFKYDTDEIKDCIIEKIKKVENGWWYAIILTALINYDNNLSETTTISEINSTIIKNNIFKNIEEIIDIIISRILSPVTDLPSNQKNINPLLKLINKNLIKIMSDERFLAFTDIKIASEMGSLYKNVIIYIQNHILFNDSENSYNNSLDKISVNISKIIISESNKKTNIKPYLENINDEIYKLKLKPLSIINHEIYKNKIITLEDFSKHIEKDGVSYEL